jgi:hypothetical protein
MILQKQDLIRTKGGIEMNKVLTLFENVGWAFNHPIKVLKMAFCNDTSAAWMFGLIAMFTWFGAYAMASATLKPLAITTVLLVGVGLFFGMAFMYYSFPTEDEHWGRAPKRTVTKVMYWIFAIAGIAAVLIGAGLLYFMT